MARNRRGRGAGRAQTNTGVRTFTVSLPFKDPVSKSGSFNLSLDNFPSLGATTNGVLEWRVTQVLLVFSALNPVGVGLVALSAGNEHQALNDFNAILANGGLQIPVSANRRTRSFPTAGDWQSTGVTDTVVNVGLFGTTGSVGRLVAEVTLQTRGVKMA